MQVKKMIRLINDEHKTPRITSAKGCNTGATDVCEEIDMAECYLWAVDVCVKDYKDAHCGWGAEDYCTIDLE